MKIIIFITVLIIKITNIFCQKIDVYIDDSLYIKNKKLPISAGEFKVELKDTLPDGTYYLYNLTRCDSAKKDINNIIMIGTYKNNLKHGEFYEYLKFLDENSSLSEIKNYKNGVLNGLQGFIHNGAPLKFYNNYNNGKLDGIQITMGKYYVKKNPICYLMRIDNYKNDTLIGWIEFYSNGNQFRRIEGSLLHGRAMVYEYNHNGELTRKIAFEEGEILWIEKYENIILNEKIVYNNEPDKISCGFTISDDGSSYFVYNTLPVNGYILYYDKNGNIIQKVEYKNGKMLE